MNANEFKAKIEVLLDPVEVLILEMPDMGDKECDSQKITLLAALNDLYASVNGVEDNDFEPDETNH